MDPKRYPGKRFKSGEPPRYVQSEADDAALGPEWSDSERPRVVVDEAPKRGRKPKAEAAE